MGSHFTTGRQDPLRIAFAGTPAAAVPSLVALLDSGHDVAAVITRPAARSGRGRTLSSSPVADLAAKAGVQVLTPQSPRDPDFVKRLEGLATEAAAVVAYGALLPPSVLAIPTHGWVNLHFSLLPAWRGASPVQAAIRSGDDITGASTFLLEAGMDTGPVFGVVTETIRPDDTAGGLLERLSISGAQLLLATLDGLQAGALEARPQAADGVSYAGKVTTADAQVDWSTPAASIDRLIRSVTPEPGAWTETPWGRMGLGPVQIASASDPAAADRTAGTDPAGIDPVGIDPARLMQAAALAPGEIAASKNEVLVGTATDPVRLGRLTPPGRRPMAAADWARGVRPAPGTVLA